MDRSLLIGILSATLTGFLNAIVYLMWIANSIPEFNAFIFVSFVGASIVLLAVVVWGIPIHFLLKHCHKKSIGWYILVGSIPSLLIPLDYLIGGNYPNLILDTLFFIYVGVSASIAFWLAVKQSMPNKPFKQDF
jgi:hypothetical protein